jgi:hypothetical protein
MRERTTMVTFTSTTPSAGAASATGVMAVAEAGFSEVLREIRVSDVLYLMSEFGGSSWHEPPSDADLSCSDLNLAARPIRSTDAATPATEAVIVDAEAAGREIEAAAAAGDEGLRSAYLPTPSEAPGGTSGQGATAKPTETSAFDEEIQDLETSSDAGSWVVL